MAAPSHCRPAECTDRRSPGLRGEIPPAPGSLMVGARNTHCRRAPPAGHRPVPPAVSPAPEPVSDTRDDHLAPDSCRWLPEQLRPWRWRSAHRRFQGGDIGAQHRRHCHLVIPWPACFISSRAAVPGSFQGQRLCKLPARSSSHGGRRQRQGENRESVLVKPPRWLQRWISKGQLGVESYHLDPLQAFPGQPRRWENRGCHHPGRRPGVQLDKACASSVVPCHL